MSTALGGAWDDVAESLAQIPLAGERVRYAAAIKPLLSLSRDAHILEAGCGSGRVLRALAALGFEHLVGVEISEARLEHVRRLGPPLANLVCSEGLPFAADTFDAVISAAVIEHVANPVEWLGQIGRLTTEGGLVSIATDTYIWRWLKQFGLYRSIQPIDDAIWPWRLIRWARRSGLDLIGCGGFVNTPDQSWYFARQLLRLAPISRKLRKRFKRKFRKRFKPVHTPKVHLDETEAILEAVNSFPLSAKRRRWQCVWSYECYYWFRKRSKI